MSEYILEKFWDDYYEFQGERQTDVALYRLLRNFRRSLDTSSKTAYSIDRQNSLDEIINHAKEEEFLEFAELVSFAQKHLD